MVTKMMRILADPDPQYCLQDFFKYALFFQPVHHVGRSSGSAADLSERIGVARRNLETQFGGSSLVPPGTPLSGIVNYCSLLLCPIGGDFILLN